MSAAIGVVGGGMFGQALATAVARNGGAAILWSRRAVDVPHDLVSVSEDLSRLAECELIFVSVPSMHVPKVAPRLTEHLDGRHLLVHVSRGLIGDELETVSRHLARHTAARRVGCLAGPLNPEVLRDAAPGGGVVGTGFPEVAAAVRDAIGGPELRLYETSDTVGVEVASAMVGLLALAAGFCLEAKISPAAMGIMMNRGLAEAARVGTSLGGRADTFHALAGSGDLFAAVASDERAEVRLGRAMAKGLSPEDAAKEAGAYIEGITIARRVANHAALHALSTPICDVMADVFEGKASISDGLGRLMSR